MDAFILDPGVKRPGLQQFQRPNAEFHKRHRNRPGNRHFHIVSIVPDLEKCLKNETDIRWCQEIVHEHYHRKTQFEFLRAFEIWFQKIQRFRQMFFHGVQTACDTVAYGPVLYLRDVCSQVGKPFLEAAGGRGNDQSAKHDDLIEVVSVRLMKKRAPIAAADLLCQGADLWHSHAKTLPGRTRDQALVKLPVFWIREGLKPFHQRIESYCLQRDHLRDQYNTSEAGMQ